MGYVGTMVVGSAFFDADGDGCRNGNYTCHVGFVQMSASKKMKGELQQVNTDSSTGLPSKKNKGYHGGKLGNEEGCNRSIRRYLSSRQRVPQPRDSANHHRLR